MKFNTAGPAPAFLTVQELAARWKTSPRTVRRLIADGRLQVHRIGRLVRIAFAVIVLFEAENGPAA
jgi:excisionase family DNA binding protein